VTTFDRRRVELDQATAGRRAHHDEAIGHLADLDEQRALVCGGVRGTVWSTTMVGDEM